jgi:hypothetical protein
VVVKQIVGGPDADARFAREVAALRLAGHAPTPVVPALLGTDPRERVLVLEHLEHRRPSSGWIVDHAAAPARLHATARPQDAESLPRWQGPGEAGIDSFLGLAVALHVPVPSGVADEFHRVLERLAAHPDGRRFCTGTPARATTSTRPAASASSTSNRSHSGTD